MYRAVIASCVICISTPALAEVQTYKDWYFKSSPDIWEAFTANASGSTLGMVCIDSVETCVFYYRDTTNCNEGDNYPVLVNAAGGSFSAETTCKLLGEKSDPTYINVFSNFELIRSTILKEHEIGLAIPLASGQFKVIRFSLSGSNESIAAAAKAAEKGNVSTIPAKGRNQVL